MTGFLRPVKPLIRRTAISESHEPTPDSLPAMPGLEPMSPSGSNTAPQSDFQPRSEGWPFPAQENASEALPEALPTLPEAQESGNRKVVELGEPQPVPELQPTPRVRQVVDLGSATNVPPLAPIPRQPVPALIPVSREASVPTTRTGTAWPEDVKGQEAITENHNFPGSAEQMSPVLVEGRNEPVMEATSEIREEVVAEAANGVPALVRVSRQPQEGFPALQPIVRTETPAPVQGVEVPHLETKARDIHGYVILGYTEAGEYDVHGIYLPDRLNTLMGVTIEEKMQHLINEKFNKMEGAIADRREAKHLTVSFVKEAAGRAGVVLKATVTDDDTYPEREGDDQTPAEPFEAYQFIAFRFKMNDLGDTFRISAFL